MDRSKPIIVEHWSMNEVTFQQRLRAAIEADPDLTPAGLAVKAGLDNSTVRQILNGRASSPRLDTAMKICTALGTTIERFLSDPQDQVDQDIADLMSELEPGERQLLIGYAEGLRASRDSR